MKKIFFGLAALVFVLAISCAHLRINPDWSSPKDEIPTKNEIDELNALLQTVSFPQELEMNVFDCSNSTAYMYDFLTAKGYKCTIATGVESLWRLIFGGPLGRGHAWLIAEKNGKKFIVESTTRIVADPRDYKEYFWQMRFDSPEEAKNFWKNWGLSEGSPGEWDY